MRKLFVLALFSAFSGAAFAAPNCSIDITANDAMQFSTKEIIVDKSCKDFTVNLKHIGKQPKKAMGHNWMLTKQDDMKAVVAETQKAAATDYNLVNDPRIIAVTKLLGGGESDSIKFSTSKLTANTPYSFFCSFPGHFGLMKGTLTVK